MTDRQPDIEQLTQWDQSIVWHAFSQMADYQPFLIERAEGCTLYDIEGRPYLDAVSSLWCNLHGHRHAKIDAAIVRQLDQVAHVTSLGTSHPTTIRLAKKLTDLAPARLAHVFFSSDGTCAIEAALKMSFQYWRQRKNPRPEKSKFLAFTDAYHGDSIGSASVGGVARFHAMFEPLLFEVVRLPPPAKYPLPPGVAAENACAYYLEQLETTLRQQADEIAAVILEPLVQAAAGIMTHPRGFLKGVRNLTRQYDVLLIADEVAVGCGRTGTMFACEQEEVSPDFLCLGKGLSGGYLPLAATLATTEIWNAFLGSYAESKTFYHGHTYTGNPLACAAALATLEIFEEENTLAGLPPKIARLAEHLESFRDHPHVGDVRQCGLIAGVELVQDRAGNVPYAWEEKRGIRACDKAKEYGVWLRPLGNVIVIMPPLSITLAELDQICRAVAAGIDEATLQSA